MRRRNAEIAGPSLRNHLADLHGDLLDSLKVYGLSWVFRHDDLP